MSRYFYFILFIVLGASAGLWPFLLDAELPTPCSEEGEGSTNLCSLNLSFNASFDPASCAITLFNVWSDYRCTEGVYINLENGQDWIPITPDQPLILSDINDCDNLRISQEAEGKNSITYTGMLACTCGPCTPVDAVANTFIQQVLADPMSNYLDNSCCCTDYDFIFPDGTRVQAIATTLHLRVDAMNSKFHSIVSVDEVGKTISLD
jgi:hypothetical protein